MDLLEIFALFGQGLLAAPQATYLLLKVLKLVLAFRRLLRELGLGGDQVRVQLLLLLLDHVDGVLEVHYLGLALLV